MSASEVKDAGRISVQAAYVLMCVFLQKYMERGEGQEEVEAEEEEEFPEFRG